MAHSAERQPAIYSTERIFMPYHPFGAVKQAPPDPILGLTELFRVDPNPQKINLTVGVFLDDRGVNPILGSVKQAEKILLEKETTKSYLAIPGGESYGEVTRELLFGAGHPVLNDARAVTMQTPGGTGALRLGADFLASQFPGAHVWISDPTWANHRAVFSAAGLEVKTYPYLDMEKHGLRFREMSETLENIPEGDVVLLHGCCHNPSGIDPTREQWEELCRLFSGRPIIPFFDIAYQGLGAGLEEDALAVRTFGNEGIEMLVAASFSKSFGLYRERVGSLTLVGSSPEEAQKALDSLKIYARSNYSNPPAHGGLVVETVLLDQELRELWLRELDGMRERIRHMRAAFVDTLQALGVGRDFGFLKKQKGIFSFSGIHREEVVRLREEYSIYMLENGRINVAGITPANLEYLCRSIAAVLKG